MCGFGYSIIFYWYNSISTKSGFRPFWKGSLHISMKISNIHRTHYVNTVIAYLVILTSGSVDFYPRCNAPNDPVCVCHTMALRNVTCENWRKIIIWKWHIWRKGWTSDTNWLIKTFERNVTVNCVKDSYKIFIFGSLKRLQIPIRKRQCEIRI